MMDVSADRLCSLIEEYTEDISCFLIPSEIIPLLKKDEVITQDEYEEIENQEKNFGKVRASRRLLEILVTKPLESDWTGSILDALRAKGYTYLVDFLEDRIPFLDIYFHKLLDEFKPNICEAVDALQLLPHCEKRQLIGGEDKEHIEAETANNGPTKGAHVLLDRVRRKCESWYPDFMYILLITGFGEVVEYVDPDLAKHDKLESIRQYCFLLKNEYRRRNNEQRTCSTDEEPHNCEEPTDREVRHDHVVKKNGEVFTGVIPWENDNDSDRELDHGMYDEFPTAGKVSFSSRPPQSITAKSQTGSSSSSTRIGCQCTILKCRTKQCSCNKAGRPCGAQCRCSGDADLCENDSTSTAAAGSLYQPSQLCATEVTSEPDYDSPRWELDHSFDEFREDTFGAFPTTCNQEYYVCNLPASSKPMKNSPAESQTGSSTPIARQGCQCKVTKCRTKKCSCNKAGRPCGAQCTCCGDADLCENDSTSTAATGSLYQPSQLDVTDTTSEKGSVRQLSSKHGEASSASSIRQSDAASLTNGKTSKTSPANNSASSSGRSSSGQQRCQCTSTKCSNNKCSCRKSGRSCGPQCKCRGNATACENDAGSAAEGLANGSAKQPSFHMYTTETPSERGSILHVGRTLGTESEAGTSQSDAASQQMNGKTSKSLPAKSSASSSQLRCQCTSTKCSNNRCSCRKSGRSCCLRCKCRGNTETCENAGIGAAAKGSAHGSLVYTSAMRSPEL